MQLEPLFEALPTRCDEAGLPQLSVTGLTDDSRQVAPGTLFIDRPGPDGTSGLYLDDAVKRGASAILTQNPPSRDVGVPVIVTPRVDQALCGELAERFYGQPSRSLKCVGVTGTNGKTTTTFVVQHLLAAAGVKAGLIGTVLLDDGRSREQASLTTPGAIETSRLLASMVSHGCGAVAMELSSHGLHQGRTAALDIDVAVFTNLTGDHLDYHKTMDAYAAAKAILFEQLDPEAWAVVNIDDPYADRMLRDCKARVLRCTLNPEAGDCEGDPNTCRGTILSMKPTSTHARFAGPWGSVEVELPLVGRHNVMNVLQAIAAANCVSAMARHLRKALQTCPAPPGRLEPVRLPLSHESPVTSHQSPPPGVLLPGVLLPGVLVDYAHTSDALENVLLALRPLTRGRLITLFGCGGDRDKTKRPQMASIACRLSDHVVITSDNPRTEDPLSIIGDILKGVSEQAQATGRVTVEPDRRKAIHLAVGLAQSDDTVLLAGKGHEDYQIVGRVKHPFDDRVHAAEALMQWALHHKPVSGPSR
ncbi:MAG: UDP-N-acetylmuramoyl-L-alanyl-D-glutamate--2,6-diaminopimelate ligase [Phycisphaera sp.]|nr:UDP-N-acetylmuramoyl-L-alanyl-D-glutamate--2,6-diaminopimelate ligase [Phycisphaera sp.]